MGLGFVVTGWSLGGESGRRVCTRRVQRACTDQLVSKPVRPRDPSSVPKSAPITDFSQLTDVRPDPVKQDGADTGEGAGGEGEIDDGDPDVLYYSQCGKCGAVYELRPKMLGKEGCKVQCSVCKNQWYQKRDKLLILDPETQELEDFPAQKVEHYQKMGSASSRGPAAAPSKSANFTAFIGNLSFQTTREELVELFSNRDVSRVHLVEKDGKSKGFAFVDFKTREDLDAAMTELNGYKFAGRELTVKEGRNSL